MSTTAADRHYKLPPLGDNPSTGRQGTTPGSFANRGRIGTAWTFSSPDTPGMPPISDKTAWDFLPDGWSTTAAPRAEDVNPTRCPLCGATNGCAMARSPGTAGSEACWCSGVKVEQGQLDRLPNDVSRRACLCASCAATPAERWTRTAFTQADGTLRTVVHPLDFLPLTQLEHARLGVITPEMAHVATRESHLTAEQIRDEVAAGRMIIPANKVHLKYKLEPMCIGRAGLTKVNANMGASPVSSGTHEELEKLAWAVKWGGDTVMDLSTGGDLDECRTAIIRNSTVPIGTVPIYSMIIGRSIEDLTYDIILEEIEKQAQQGVDYFTIHAGVRRAHLPHVRNRLIGIVSRGGSLLAKWMIHHGRENPMYEIFDDICDIMRQYDVSFSLGDGLRPGGLADATDRAQLLELQTLAELTERAWSRGCQVMVEGPGHVPFDQIEYNMKLQRTLCHGAPFYVLGPLVTDIFPGYDHITSCIGATAAAYHGAAMLCYVTPKEHLGLPKKDDVKQGCVAYKIAAHAADVALGIPHTRDRDDELTKARAALNWQRHFDLSFDPDLARAYHDEDLDVDTDFCAMCGHDWCSVRISKEITDFYSGKDESYAWEKPTRSAALTPEQQEILKSRGVLSPEQIHQLAHKLSPDRKGAGHPPKPACHSDNVPDAKEAQVVQLTVLSGVREEV